MSFSNRKGRGLKYGAEHQAARRAAAAAHQPWHPCSICRRPLGPMGSNLHLDHTPDGRGYRGFAHRSCNQSDGARRGAQIVNASRERRSRWKPRRAW